MCQIIADTGSNISIVHPDVVTTTGRLCTMTGETAPLQQRKTVQLTTGPLLDATCSVGGRDSRQVHHWDGLPSEAWLGCLVDLKEGILHTGEEEVPLHTPQVSELSCYRCCAKSSVTLPPKSETLVPAQVEGEWIVDGLPPSPVPTTLRTIKKGLHSLPVSLSSVSRKVILKITWPKLM